MLNNLRTLIDNQTESEEMSLAMLEATDSTIADSFMDNGDDAEIPESELTSILSKIPAYDEEAELNKKLSKITECYIPETL